MSNMYYADKIDKVMNILLDDIDNEKISDDGATELWDELQDAVVTQIEKHKLAVAKKKEGGKIRRHVENGKLILETDNHLYVVVCQYELQGFQDFYVEDETGVSDYLNHVPINDAYDFNSTDYCTYFIFKYGDEKHRGASYIGEPTERFSMEWAEKTIIEYEERGN